jgi:hypothetical protein
MDPPPIAIAGIVGTVSVAAPAGTWSAISPPLIEAGPTGLVTVAAPAGAFSLTAFAGATGRVTVAAPAGVFSLTPNYGATGRVSVAAPAGVAEIAPLVSIDVPPEWSWEIIRPSTGAHLGSLTVATARKITWQLDGAATAQFTMPGEHAETEQVVELARDVLVGRNGIPLFRGRIGASSDDLSATAEATQFVANDYRGMLDRRVFWSTSTLTFRAADEADIAWQLIADTQATAGGNWGVTRGNAPQTGVLRDRDFVGGNVVGTSLADLGRVLDGFDWEIDSQLRFNLYHPQRGRALAVPLVYGRDALVVKANLDPTKYANAVYFTGTSATTPAQINVGSFDADIGRWDVQKADPNVDLQATIDERAAWELQNDSAAVPSFQVTMRSGSWNPNVLWLGDAVHLVVNGGRLAVDVVRRIVQIDVTLTDDGEEQVQLTIGATPLRLSDLLKQQQATTNALSTGSGGGGPPISPFPPLPPTTGGGPCSLPTGGDTGQILQKQSSTDCDAAWVNPSVVRFPPLVGCRLTGGFTISLYATFSAWILFPVQPWYNWISGINFSPAYPPGDPLHDNFQIGNIGFSESGKYLCVLTFQVNAVTDATSFNIGMGPENPAGGPEDGVAMTIEQVPLFNPTTYQLSGVMSCFGSSYALSDNLLLSVRQNTGTGSLTIIPGQLTINKISD